MRLSATHTPELYTRPSIFPDKPIERVNDSVDPWHNGSSYLVFIDGPLFAKVHQPIRRDVIIVHIVS